jgi:hypothetical protein
LFNILAVISICIAKLQMSGYRDGQGVLIWISDSYTKIASFISGCLKTESIIVVNIKIKRKEDHEALT